MPRKKKYAQEGASAKEEPILRPGEIVITDESGMSLRMGIDGGQISRLATREELAAACGRADEAAERAEQAGSNIAVMHELLSRQADRVEGMLEKAGDLEAGTEAAAAKAAEAFRQEAEGILREMREALEGAKAAAGEAAESARAARAELEEFHEAVGSFKQSMLSMFRGGGD